MPTISSPPWARKCRTLCRKSRRSSSPKLRPKSRSAASLLVAVEPPDALLTSGHLRLSPPGEDRHPHPEASHAPRDLARRIHPHLLAHRPRLVDLHLRPQRVVDRKEGAELLANRRLGERARSVALRHVTQHPHLVHGLEPLGGVSEGIL